MSKPKSIVITGISSELGNIAAHEFAREDGSQIIGTMRRSLRADDGFPPNIHVFENCDLTKPECCMSLARLASEKFSEAFGFVHSVGDFWEHVPFLDFGPDQARKMF